MPRRLVTPDFCSDAMIGITVSANRSAAGSGHRALPRLPAQRWWGCRASCLAACERRGRLGSVPKLPPLLLGQSRVEMQHERIGVGAEFGDDEGHTLGHQAGNEGHVAREAIELGNQHRTFRLARCGQRCGKLWPSIKRVGALAGFDLGELCKERDAFALRKNRRLPFAEPLAPAPIRSPHSAREYPPRNRSRLRLCHPNSSHASLRFSA